MGSHMTLPRQARRSASPNRGDMRPRRGVRAQALVEFSLIAPVLFLIICAAVDISRAAYYYGAMSSDARKTVREMSLPTSPLSDCQILTDAVNETFIHLVPDPKSVNGNQDPTDPGFFGWGTD